MGGFWRVRTNHCRRRIDARIRRLKGLRMRAVVCTRYGPPEVLQVKELATPVPRKNEVRIRILATAVTSSDCYVRGLNLSPAYRLMARLALGWSAAEATRARHGALGGGGLRRTGRQLVRSGRSGIRL